MNMLDVSVELNHTLTATWQNKRDDTSPACSHKTGCYCLLFSLLILVCFRRQWKCLQR